MRLFLHRFFFAWGWLILSCSHQEEASAPQFLTLENETLYVTLKTQGAELQSIQHKETGREYLWQGDSTYWGGRAPIMFPVNVRFKDEQFTYQDKPYEMPRMGLAKAAQFSVLPSANNQQAVLEFTSNSETLTYYPFPFQLTLTFRLEGNKLVHQFQSKIRVEIRCTLP